MSCMYDDDKCKYYEEGRCDFPIMGSGYPYDAPCFGFDYEDDEDWILVSEQLPEEEVDVLCVTLAGAMFVASYGQLYFDPNEKGWITAEFNRFCTETVYAWTELPEKPKVKGVTE